MTGPAPPAGDEVADLAARAAAAIAADFRAYHAEFARITRRAARRFLEREWSLGQRDAVERIELYEHRVERCVAGLVPLMGTRVAQEGAWAAAKSAYGQLVSAAPDRELHLTFFNSITRKVFGTVGVNPTLEFAGLEAAAPTGAPPLAVIACGADPGGAAGQILALAPGDVADDEAGIEALAALLREGVRGRRPHAIEMLVPVFYRSTRAFLVGRLVAEGRSAPFVIALRNDGAGPAVDAVISAEPEVRTLFGFSRSYFHVDLPEVGPVVEFLREMLPRKSTAEIYTVLGRARQGKTERFRSLYRHLASSADPFTHAAGQRGMVMAVFTLPSWDSVFKVIRDRFAWPKSASREEVMDRYRLVFRHDRAGRLVDAQEFRRLRLPRARFEPALLDELLGECAGSCRLEGDDLILEHCYIERRLVPLDVHLRSADPERAAAAVRDYGHAIRELALSNIFPGDLLLKNFGVSANGRVIFYDYDELCLLTDCRFRDLPAPRVDEDETRGEPWFYVGENDVFPAQFMDFLGLKGSLREEFERYHADLLTASFWQQVRACHAEERLLEVVPYRTSRSMSLSTRPAATSA